MLFDSAPSLQSAFRSPKVRQSGCRLGVKPWLLTVRFSASSRCWLAVVGGVCNRVGTLKNDRVHVAKLTLSPRNGDSRETLIHSGMVVEVLKLIIKAATFVIAVEYPKYVFHAICQSLAPFLVCPMIHHVASISQVAMEQRHRLAAHLCDCLTPTSS